jgi:8-oxo-dGTP pyrophosphatase MutT (NUDIX family)
MRAVRSRVIIVQDHCVALIKRERPGRDTYYLFPGGGLEAGETSEEAAVREALEELGLHIRVQRLVGMQEIDGMSQYYYLASVEGGTFGTGQGREIIGPTDPVAGVYTPLWIPISKLSSYNVRPPRLAEALSTGRIAGWNAVHFEE